jgi:hypothetical protein
MALRVIVKANGKPIAYGVGVCWSHIKASAELTTVTCRSVREIRAATPKDNLLVEVSDMTGNISIDLFYLTAIQKTTINVGSYSSSYSWTGMAIDKPPFINGLQKMKMRLKNGAA